MVKGAFVLGLEDTGSRMSRLAKGELLYGELLPRRRAAAPGSTRSPPDEVNEVAAELLGRPMSLAVIGPFDDRRLRGRGLRPGSVEAPAVRASRPVERADPAGGRVRLG